MIFDPLYLLFALPGLLLGLWARNRVKSNFNKYSKVRTARNLTGAQVARALLNEQGLAHVAIEESQGGTLSDHYDPRSETLRLSSGVARSASVGVSRTWGSEPTTSTPSMRSSCVTFSDSMVLPQA